MICAAFLSNRIQWVLFNTLSEKAATATLPTTKKGTKSGQDN